MKCSNCGFQQDEGKFCGKCGESLVAQSEDAVEETSASSEVTNPGQGNEQQSGNHHVPVTPTPNESNAPNESLEKVKETSRAYGGFFVNYLKNPAQAFANKSSELTNALISIGLVVLLTIFSFIVSLNNQLGGFSSYGPSFISVFFNLLIGIGVIMAVVISLLFLINKLFGSDSSYKDIVSIYGAHMTPVIAVSGVTLILAILKSNMFGTLLLMIAMLLIIFVIPLYLMSSLLTRRPKGIDPFYGYLLYIGAFMVAFSIVLNIIVDSTMGRMIYILEDLMYYM